MKHPKLYSYCLHCAVISKKNFKYKNIINSFLKFFKKI